MKMNIELKTRMDKILFYWFALFFFTLAVCLIELASGYPPLDDVMFYIVVVFFMIYTIYMLYMYEKEKRIEKEPDHEKFEKDLFETIRNEYLAQMTKFAKDVIEEIGDKHNIISKLFTKHAKEYLENVDNE